MADIQQRGLRLDTSSPPVIPRRSPLRPPASRDSTTSDNSPSLSSASASKTSLDSDPPLSSTMSKRQHALLELLESERAYASDLALVREVHIPLALGQPVSIASSSSSASSSGSSSSSASSQPPMTPDDTRTIFSNIVELAVLSDSFVEALPRALGSSQQGTAESSDDTVGLLFLSDIIPSFKTPYTSYISRHPSASAHLAGLPKTPELAAYYEQTRNLSTSVSHAWDLHSLLIKPVQRLLKYPLLLNAIIDETPEDHPDRENLIKAREGVEEVARSVNEDRRRAEVVREVLTSKSKSNINISVAASVNLGKIKHLRKASGGASLELEGEAKQVERMEAELKRIEVFAQQFARNLVDWSKSAEQSILALCNWARSFGAVIGLSTDDDEDEEGCTSEAYSLFMQLVSTHLTGTAGNLTQTITSRILKDLAHLLSTTSLPLKLLASMKEQAPLHSHLLNTPISAKNRPNPALLEASTNYLALRGQLARELPRYLEIMHRGLTLFVFRFAELQADYWRDVKEGWQELWEALRVDGEGNGGAEETIQVWGSRWQDVGRVIDSLAIVKPPVMPIPMSIYSEHSYAPSMNGTVKSPSIAPSTSPTSPNTLSKSRSGKSNRTSRSRPPAAAKVSSVLMSLEPAHSPLMQQVQQQPPHQPRSAQVSSPHPLSPSTSHRSSGTSSSSFRRRRSSDSLRSRTTAQTSVRDSRDSKGSSGGSRESREVATATATTRSPSAYRYRESDEMSMMDYVNIMSVPLPSGPLLTSSNGPPKAPTRTKSMNLPKISGDDVTPTGEEERGRLKPSFRRRISDTIRGAPPTTTPHSAPISKPRSISRGRRRSSPEHVFEGPWEEFELAYAPYSPPSEPHSAPTLNPWRALEVSPKPPRSQPPQQQQERQPHRKQPQYLVECIHSLQPPARVAYRGYPFLSLNHTEVWGVLEEAGHPREHKHLPIHVDEGDDTLLLLTGPWGSETKERIGWALASFLKIVE